MFSVRLVTADSYQAQPLPQLDPTFSVFRGSEIKNVPVIRVFGTTPKGEKTCLHVHGVFPYLYIPYTGEENEDRVAYRLAASLDAAINISLGNANSTNQHVYQIQRVAGIPFYGYHKREHQFFKISFYNPAIMKKAADLLQTGAVLGQSLQAHEAHLNYTLQFMMDYNLYGMSFINLSNVKHRRVNQSSDDMTTSYDSVITPVDNVEYLPVNVLRQSICEVEIDAIASDILNREDLAKGIELNPGLSAIWNEERERRRQVGLGDGDSQLVNPKSPQRPPSRPTDSDLYHEQRLARRLSMISQCDESTLSMSTNPTPYPAEVIQGDVILNASNFGTLSTPTSDKTQRPNETLSLSSLGSTQCSQTSHECSVLDSDDLPLVELLENLARDSDTKDSVDEDSMLGTQVSSLNPDEDKSDEESCTNEDLNLTCLELDSWSSWEGAKRPSTLESSQRSLKSPISDDDMDSTLLGALLAVDIDSVPPAYSVSPRSSESSVPQLDGAGDICSSFLDSEEEENMQMEVEHESQMVETTVTYPNQAVISTPTNSSLSPSTSSTSSEGSSMVPSETYLDQYNMEYEALDDDFVEDIENIMQENIMMEMNFTCGEEVPVSNSLAEDEAIPIERVLNGDPCFTQTAELDKSDLTELQDQYVSLLDSELLSEIYENSQNLDLINNAVSEETENCQVVGQTSGFITTESVVQNIQETELCKQNLSLDVNVDDENCEQVNLTSDSSDYNCNVVARWDEIHDLNYLPKGTIKRKCTQKFNNQVVEKRRCKIAKSEVTSGSNDVCELSRETEVNTLESSKIQYNQLREKFMDGRVLPGVQYSSYLLGENENLVTPILPDFEELVEPLSPPENSCFASDYCSDRSHKGVIFGEDQHKHCVYSFNHRKFVQDYVFTSNEIWIIEKRKRGKAGESGIITSEICSRECRLPYVPLEKINIGVENNERLNIEVVEDDLHSIKSTLYNNTSNDPHYVLSEVDPIEGEKVSDNETHRNTLTRITRQSERNFIQSPSLIESGDGPVIIRRVFEEKTSGSTCVKKRSIILKVGSNTESQSDDSRVEDKSKLPMKMKRKLRRSKTKVPEIPPTIENPGQLPREKNPSVPTIQFKKAVTHDKESSMKRPSLLCSIKTKRLGTKWLLSLTSKHPSKVTNQRSQSKLPIPRPQIRKMETITQKYKLRRREPEAESISPAMENEKVEATTSLVTAKVEFNNSRELAGSIHTDNVAVITESEEIKPSSSSHDKNPVENDETTPIYTTTVAEVNLYSGKDYTIDAVSQEIPQLLFAEDSNASFNENTMNMISLKRSVDEIVANSIADQSENSSVKSFDGDEYSDHESGILSMADDSGSNGTVNNDAVGDAVISPSSFRALLIDELQERKRCERCEKCDCNSYMTMLTKSSHTMRTGSARSERIFLEEEKMSLVTKSIFRLIGGDIDVNASRGTILPERHFDSEDDTLKDVSDGNLDSDFPSEEGKHLSSTPKSSPKKISILRKIYSSNSESLHSDGGSDCETKEGRRRTQVEVCDRGDLKISGNLQGKKRANQAIVNLDDASDTDSVELNSNLSVIDEYKTLSEVDITGTMILTNDKFRVKEKCSKSLEHTDSYLEVVLDEDNNMELIMDKEGGNSEETLSCTETEKGERFSGECGSDSKPTSTAVLLSDYNYKFGEGSTENIVGDISGESTVVMKNVEMCSFSDDSEIVSDSLSIENRYKYHLPLIRGDSSKRISSQSTDKIVIRSSEFDIDETTRDTFILETENDGSDIRVHSNICGMDELSIADTIIVDLSPDTSRDNNDKPLLDSDIVDEEHQWGMGNKQLSGDAITGNSEESENSHFIADKNSTDAESIDEKGEDEFASGNGEIDSDEIMVGKKYSEGSVDLPSENAEVYSETAELLSMSDDYIEEIVVIEELEENEKNSVSNDDETHLAVDENFQGVGKSAKVSCNDDEITEIDQIKQNTKFSVNDNYIFQVADRDNNSSVIEKDSEDLSIHFIKDYESQIPSVIKENSKEPGEYVKVSLSDNDNSEVHSNTEKHRGVPEASANVSVNDTVISEDHSMIEREPSDLDDSYELRVSDSDNPEDHPIIAQLVESLTLYVSDNDLSENLPNLEVGSDESAKVSLSDYDYYEIPRTVEEPPEKSSQLFFSETDYSGAHPIIEEFSPEENSPISTLEISEDPLPLNPVVVTPEIEIAISPCDETSELTEIEFSDSPEPSEDETINVIINNLAHDEEVEEGEGEEVEEEEEEEENCSSDSNEIIPTPESANDSSESTDPPEQSEDVIPLINRVKQSTESLLNELIIPSPDLPTTEVPQPPINSRRLFVKLERLNPDLVTKYLKPNSTKSNEETPLPKIKSRVTFAPEIFYLESDETEPLRDDSDKEKLKTNLKVKTNSAKRSQSEEITNKVLNESDATSSASIRVEHDTKTRRKYPVTPSARIKHRNYSEDEPRSNTCAKLSEDIVSIKQTESQIIQLDGEVPETSDDSMSAAEPKAKMKQTFMERLMQEDLFDEKETLNESVMIEIIESPLSSPEEQVLEPVSTQLPESVSEPELSLSLPETHFPRLEFTRRSKIPSKRTHSPSSSSPTAVSILSSQPLESSILNDLHHTQTNRYMNAYVIQSAYRTKHHTVSVDRRLVLTQISTKDSKLRPRSEKERFLVQLGLYPLNPDLEENWVAEDSHVAYIQRQEPRVMLNRLNAPTLKRYGYNHRFKSNRFGKRFVNGQYGHNDFRIPAYDGPADLTSDSETSDNEADITIQKEKLVCAYKPRKTRENLVTPKKRNHPISPDDLDSPTAAKRLCATPKRTPSRPSMLKSPGRLSGNYTPLKIIVTSPKVRREAHDTTEQLRIDADGADKSSAYCLTPRRRKQGLHENLLRARIPPASPIQRSGSDDRKLELTSIEKTSRDETSGTLRRGGRETNCQKTTIEEKLSNVSQDVSMVKEMNVRKNLFTGKELRVLQDINFSPIPSTSRDVQVQTEYINDKNAEIKATEGNILLFDDEEDFELKYSTLQASRLDEVEEENEKTIEFEEEEENLCDVTFTQFIYTQLSKKKSKLESSSQPLEDPTKSIKIIPRFNPPTNNRIKTTMESYGIPTCRNAQPFFSKQADAPGQKELAHKMLKVPGKGLVDVALFKSAMEDVTGLIRWRRMKINEFHPSKGKIQASSIRQSLAGYRSIIITPLLHPPSLKNVKTWIKARDILKRKKGDEQKAKEEEKKQQTRQIENQKTNTFDNAESDENTSDSSNSSIVEPSPEKIINSKSLRLLGRTPRNSQVNKTLLPSTSKAYKTSESIFSMETQKSIDSDESTPSGAADKSSNKSSEKSINSTLMSMLEKSKLFATQTSKHPGISCGQIDCMSDSTRSDVENENMQNAKAVTTYQYITLMCLEVHVTTRGNLLPDPDHDPVSAIFYAIQSDVPPTSPIRPLIHGVIAVAPEGSRKLGYSYGTNVPFDITLVPTESSLFDAFIKLVTKTDPEIFLGWELEALSWGYIFHRATTFGVNLNKKISRIPGVQCKWEATTPDLDALGEIKLPGRVVLDIWRIMRHEMALLNYSFENVMYHVMNERIPCPSFKTLTEWWNTDNLRARWRVIEHYGVRVLGVLRILEQLDIIGRTSEHARLFGIQFYEVFTRGSQFRVESIMLRLAKPLNYIAVSPSPQQRAAMRAMEALPLIMEPESIFYHDPVIVLDFQSLYPSIIIAHNYCFSTCLGRIERIGQPHPFEFGASVLKVTKNTALKLEGKVNFAPCGVAFVKPEVRLGILPRMLTEILETRFMVKKAMKDHDKNDKTLQRVLHSRQLGLKFLANVTYGYTAANFTGRMPCMEVGDSVVSKAKETLERAIKLVESTPKWGARVVYGDTDSLFILAPGKSKEEAFKIGYEMADAVTADNPSPVKLKFEKVLFPTILQTKKRYCGYMYEAPDQEKPSYLAKGIETVRRDGCPAVSKILEKTLKILFDTKDVSQVKQYVVRQLDKILRGKVSLQDLTFAKEFRGMRGYKERACVPALELTRRLMKRDPRALPRHNERVKYVIVAGAPNQALIHCVRSPWEVLNDPGLRPNCIYYITRVVIPPLNRCLNLMGVDVNTWYREMPHRQILDNPVALPSDKQKQTIFQYFGNIVCAACGQTSNKALCSDCQSRPTDTLIMLNEKLRWLERVNEQVISICQSCIGRGDTVECISLDCPILYRRAQAQRELTLGTQLEKIIKEQNIDFLNIESLFKASNVQN